MKKYILILCTVLAAAFGTTLPVWAADEISSVEITEIPAIESGASIQDTKAVFQAPEGCVVESNWFIWKAEEETYILAEEDSFTETDIYYLSVSVKAEEGYTFSEDFYFTYPEDTDADSVITWADSTEEAGTTWYFDMTPVTLATPVQRIEVTTPEAKAGKHASIDKISIYVDDELVDNENFVIDANWYCVTDDQTITGETFEAEKVYQLLVNVTAKEGYSFTGNTLFLHNDKEGLYFSYPNKLEFFKDFSLLSPVERIELSGLAALEPGSAPVNTLEITNGIENCEIFVLWYDENGDELTEQALIEDYNYTVQVEVNLYGDEPISEDFVFVIDGVEYPPTDLSAETKQAWLNREFRLGETPAGGMPIYAAWIAAALIAVTTLTGLVVAIKSGKGKKKKKHYKKKKK